MDAFKAAAGFLAAAFLCFVCAYEAMLVNKVINNSRRAFLKSIVIFYR
jgi:hypothetical protein